MNVLKLYFCFLLILFSSSLLSCESPSYDFDSETSFDSTSINYCLIDLRGEVMYPGIYKVKEGTLIVDIIELAGGFTENANITNISLVNIVDSNTKIVIPSSNNENSDNNKLININDASIADLMMLPKIGESKAKAIIEYRTLNGRFNNIEEIKDVSGIGDSLYEAIKTYITV